MIRTIPLREVTSIRKPTPVDVIVYHPTAEAGKEELARRVSDIHAAAVIQRLKSLNCPPQQRLALLDAIIHTAKNRSPQCENKSDFAQRCIV